MSIPGITRETPTSGPALELPETWEGKNICVRCSGGIGDALIVMGSVPKALKDRHPCKVTAAVMPFQVELIKQVQGPDDVVSSTQLNRTAYRSGFDVLLEMNNYILKDSRHFVDEDYYDAAAKTAGLNAGACTPGAFKFEEEPFKIRTIGLHPSASNPVRRWPEPYWENLGKRILEAGYRVIWFGTKDDPHWTGNGMLAACQITESLLEQVRMLAKCQYFIGNDSSFCHMAGMLGIPGQVIFAATHPKDAIARYPKLKGIKAFELVNIEPSRTARNDDPSAWEAMMALQPSAVFEAFENHRPF